MADRGELRGEALHDVDLYFCLAARRPDGAGLDLLEGRLATHPDEHLRRLALAALVARSGTGMGWDPSGLARLRAFRVDPSTLVASEAQFTLPAAEEEVPTGGAPS